LFDNHESKTEKIMEERSELKSKMKDNLKALNFTTIEINEVLDIVTVAERKIEKIKLGLVGSNINNDNTLALQGKAMEEIREIQKQLQIDIKDKVQEIRERKAK
jgi:hypothetical protein